MGQGGQTMTEPAVNFHITLKSENAKTGPIPVTTSPRQTCPDTCPYKDGPCYANSGPLRFHWDKVTNGSRKVLHTWDELLAVIRALHYKQLWRHNQAGDLQHGNGYILDEELRALARANKGRRGFTYTHHVLVGDSPRARMNRKAALEANRMGFTVNASCDSIDQAEQTWESGIPAVVVTDGNRPKKFRTPRGYLVVQCPATYMDNMNCARCGLCQKQTTPVGGGKEVMRPIVAFPAHGNGKKQLLKILQVQNNLEN